MDNDSLHNVLIILHTITATISFFAGSLLIFSPKYATNETLFNLYLWPLIGMGLLLAGALFVNWENYSDTERVIFPGLLGLAFFMIFRGWGASLVLHTQQKKWKLGYIEHIGFTLISLFEGFVIVSGLNAGLPGWLVGVIAFLGLLGGRWVIAYARRTNT
jgi:hypothetical protein